VAVQNDWVSVDEVDLGKINKSLHANMMAVPTPKDVLWCGFLDPYNDAFDKVTARQPVPLKRVEVKEFYPVTTTDDPVLEKLAIDGAGQVFITDASTFACAVSTADAWVGSPPDPFQRPSPLRVSASVSLVCLPLSQGIERAHRQFPVFTLANFSLCFSVYAERLSVGYRRPEAPQRDALLRQAR
jgi:hypothetical protein